MPGRPKKRTEPGAFPRREDQAELVLCSGTVHDSAPGEPWELRAMTLKQTFVGGGRTHLGIEVRQYGSGLIASLSAAQAKHLHSFLGAYLGLHELSTIPGD